MEQLELKTVINACQMEELSPADQHLMSLAIEATHRSYAPYSHFHVGAAVRLDNGVEIIGCNQENAAYPSGLCAERTALELLEEPCSPCGSCRQVIIETETRAKHPIRILLYGRRCIYIIDGIRQLMPLMFSEF